MKWFPKIILLLAFLAVAVSCTYLYLSGNCVPIYTPHSSARNEACSGWGKLATLAAYWFIVAALAYRIFKKPTPTRPEIFFDQNLLYHDMRYLKYFIRVCIAVIFGSLIVIFIYTHQSDFSDALDVNQILSFMRSVAVISGVVLFLFGLFAIYPLWRYPRRSKYLIAMIMLGGMVVIALPFSLYLLNSLLDHTPGTLYTSALTDIEHPSPPYRGTPPDTALFTNTALSASPLRLAVPSSLISRFVPGKSLLQITVHPGFFGVPWYNNLTFVPAKDPA